MIMIMIMIMIFHYLIFSWNEIFILGHLRKNELHRCCQIFFLMMLSHCFTRHFTVLDLKTITYQKKPTTRHFCALEISSIRIILKNQSPQFISCNIFCDLRTKSNIFVKMLKLWHLASMRHALHGFFTMCSGRPRWS